MKNKYIEKTFDESIWKQIKNMRNRVRRGKEPNRYLHELKLFSKRKVSE